MARFYGAVGYGVSIETSPGSGSYEDTITVKNYTGDVVRNARKYEYEDKVLGDIYPVTTISIVADAYALANYLAIRYVSWMGSLWTVTNVEVERPRLLLRLGGVYNGPTG